MALSFNNRRAFHANPLRGADTISHPEALQFICGIRATRSGRGRPMGPILVVDDDVLNRKMLSVRLQTEGYEVQTAAGGREALDLLAGRSINLMILDVMMPDMSGLEVLRILRTIRTIAELPVIMATARSESSDIVEALAAGANDYVTKPIDFPVLLARMRTHLRLQSLTREKDEFLGIASHDLKNPLAIVRSSLDIVRTCVPPGTPMPDDMPEVLERAIRHTLSMERIIGDFLDFHALEDGNLAIRHKPFDLNQVTAEALDSLADSARQKGISIVREFAEPTCSTLGDERRIEQVILNLAGNSLRFSRPGTTVRVLVAQEEKQSLFSISDEGPGLTPEDLPRLFVKYARLSNRPTGGEKSSGLGLAICSKLIAAHHGTIGAKNNTPGPGATFWFRLPCRQTIPDDQSSVPAR